MGDNFYTDVIAAEPLLLVNPNRIHNLGWLEPITRAAVAGVIHDAHTMGIQLMVFETFRSKIRQKHLFEQGATKLQNVGVHLYGLACDLVRDVNGEPSWKGDFTFLYHLAEAHGLIWGGNWGQPNLPHNFVDQDHVQRCTKSQEAALFRGEWYPEADYNPCSPQVINS